MRPDKALWYSITRTFIFTGRASRSEFWWYFLLVVLVESFIITIATENYGLYGDIFPITAGLAVLIPMPSLMVRRFHDINFSSLAVFWPLLVLLPIIFLAKFNEDIALFLLIIFALGYLIYLFITLLMFMTDGTEGPNKYGPDPKGRQQDCAYDSYTERAATNRGHDGINGYGQSSASPASAYALQQGAVPFPPLSSPPVQPHGDFSSSGPEQNAWPSPYNYQPYPWSPPAADPSLMQSFPGCQTWSAPDNEIEKATMEALDPELDVTAPLQQVQAQQSDLNCHGSAVPWSVPCSVPHATPAITADYRTSASDSASASDTDTAMMQTDGQLSQFFPYYAGTGHTHHINEQPHQLYDGMVPDGKSFPDDGCASNLTQEQYWYLLTLYWQQYYEASAAWSFQHAQAQAQAQAAHSTDTRENIAASGVLAAAAAAAPDSSSWSGPATASAASAPKSGPWSGPDTAAAGAAPDSIPWSGPATASAASAQGSGPWSGPDTAPAQADYAPWSGPAAAAAAAAAQADSGCAPWAAGMSAEQDQGQLPWEAATPETVGYVGITSWEYALWQYWYQAWQQAAAMAAVSQNQPELCVSGAYVQGHCQSWPLMDDGSEGAWMWPYAQAESESSQITAQARTFQSASSGLECASLLSAGTDDGAKTVCHDATAATSAAVGAAATAVNAGTAGFDAHADGAGAAAPSGAVAAAGAAVGAAQVLPASMIAAVIIDGQHAVLKDSLNFNTAHETAAWQEQPPAITDLAVNDGPSVERIPGYQ